MPLTDHLLLPITHLQTLVASSSTFRTEVGAVSVAAARLSIYKGDAPAWSGTSRAIVGTDGGRTFRKTGSAGWLFSGDLFVLFEFDETANAADPNAAHDSFAGKVSDILDEMAALAGTSPGSDQYLDVQEFQEDVPFLPCEPDQNAGEYFWWCMWTIRHQG